MGGQHAPPGNVDHVKAWGPRWHRKIDHPDHIALGAYDLVWDGAGGLLSFLMMITRRKAIPQVIGFLSMENGLFFAATSATYGMPMVVELGIAFDLVLLTAVAAVFQSRILAAFGTIDTRLEEAVRLTEDASVDLAHADIDTLLDDNREALARLLSPLL